MSSWVMMSGSRPMMLARCFLPMSNSALSLAMNASCSLFLVKYILIAEDIRCSVFFDSSLLITLLSLASRKIADRVKDLTFVPSTNLDTIKFVI